MEIFKKEYFKILGLVASFGLILIFVIIGITGCKVQNGEIKATETGAPAEEKTYPQTVEYNYVKANCSYDRGMSTILCIKPDGDNTDVPGVINTEAQNGWELVTVVQLGSEFDFIFSRDIK